MTGITLVHFQAALLHTLWQGACIAVAVYALLRQVPAGRANLRYGLCVAGLLGVVVAGLLTVCLLEYADGPPESTFANGVPVADATSPSAAVVAPPARPLLHPPVATAFSPSPHRLLVCWLAGVLLMGLRVLRLMRGAQRLRRQCQTVTDPRLLALLDELKAALGLSRRVVLRIGDELASPVAMGLLWPAVLLPAAMATGLPPEQLRAVIAHELAHIRRYDYLVNFVQLVIEALLYFNPFVWWLSRQVRIEREACCDALAARMAGGGPAYAEALTRVARHAFAQGAVSMAAQSLGAGRGSGLLDRLRRLLLPGYRPMLRLRWYSVAAGMLITSALLLGLYQSSALSVACAGWFLSDAQRTEVLADLQDEYSPPRESDYDEREKVTISGRVLTFDDRALPKDYRDLGGVSRGPVCVTHKSVRLREGAFKGTLPKGKLYLFAEFPGYAPTMAGPFQGDATHPVENVELRLAPSWPVTLRFLNPQGVPIAGAHVTGYRRFLENSGSHTINGTADEQGQVTLDQAEEPITLSLRVTAAGYQESSHDRLLIPPGDSYDWTLQPDVPIAGIVVDRATGAPISGAEVALVYTEGRGWRSPAPEGDVLAVSEGDGRFLIPGLNQEQFHHCLVRAQGYGTELISHVTQQERPLRVALAPRYVRGIIRGDVSQLKANRDGTGYVISSDMALEIPGRHTSHGGDASTTPVSVENGEGHFQISGLRAGDLNIYAGSQTLHVAVRASVEDLEIVLASSEAKPERPVAVRLNPPKGTAMPKGKLGVSIFDERGGHFPTPTYVDVVNGQATVMVTAPGKIKLYGDQLPGYIPTPRPKGGPDKKRPGDWRIPAGEGAYTIEMPLERAGAAYGQVVHADGRPAAEAHVYVHMQSDSSATDWPGSYSCFGSSDLEPDANGHFAVVPMPLGQTFRISASMGFTRVEKEVRLSRWRTVAQLTFRLPEGVDVPVRVIQPDGRPMAGVALKVRRASHGYGGLKTDSRGVYVARGLDPTVEYTIEAQPSHSYQYRRIPLRPDAKEHVIQLKPGLTATGLVLLEGSETPVANHRVIASHCGPTEGLGVSEVETVTNHEGRFHFGSLCAGTFKVRLDTTMTLEPVSQKSVECIAGQEEPLTLYMRPGGWRGRLF